MDASLHALTFLQCLNLRCEFRVTFYRCDKAYWQSFLSLSLCLFPENIDRVTERYQTSNLTLSKLA